MSEKFSSGTKYPKQTNKQKNISTSQYTRIKNQNETNIPTLYHEFNISEQIIRINEQIKAKSPGMFADIRAHLCAKKNQSFLFEHT